MKTILTVKIDGIDIVTGFSELQINPVKTRKNFNRKIKSLPEFIELEKISADYVKHRYRKDTSQKELEKKLKELKEKKEELSRRMGKDLDHIVYFEPKENEKSLSNAEYKEYKSLYKKAVGNGNYLSIDKTETPNLKGKEYFIDNNGVVEKKKISEIGIMIPKDAILKLSKEQEIKIKETDFLDRIGKMPKEEIKREYDSEKRKIINHTQDRAIELRLEGVTAVKAGDDAVAEFKPKLEKLKLKYSQI